MIEVNGMAHVILTVSQFDAARTFYCKLLPFLGMKKVFDGNNFVYHVGGRTALGIQRCAEGFEDERFRPNRIGLHHICLAVDKVEAARQGACHAGLVSDRTQLHPGTQGKRALFLDKESAGGVQVELTGR